MERTEDQNAIKQIIVDISAGIVKTILETEELEYQNAIIVEVIKQMEVLRRTQKTAHEESIAKLVNGSTQLATALSESFIKTKMNER